jgi:hypothetical protein
VAAVGAAEIAVIAAQQPQLHDGGMATDEYPYTLQTGEGVLSRRGVRALGGPDAVEEVNRGRPATGGGGVSLLALDGRIMDHMIEGGGHHRPGLAHRAAAFGRLPGRSRSWRER